MNKKRCIKIIILILVIFSFVNIAYAANLTDAFGVSNHNNDDPLDKVADAAGYETEGAPGRMDLIVAKGIQTVLSLLGVIFLILMIYGGFQWMTARGNEQQLEKAKNVITASVIGLIIVLSSYAISYFVVSKMSNSALNQNVNATGSTPDSSNN